MNKTTVLSLLLLTAVMASAQTLDYTIPSGQTLRFSTSPVHASVLWQDTALSGHIILPDSVTYWEMLYLPDSDVPYDSVRRTVALTGIVQQAFSHCRHITGIEIPATVASIGEAAFAYCTSLDSIRIDVRNAVYASPLGSNTIICTIDSTLLAGCRSSAIPHMVRHIYSYAFQGIRGLRIAALPDSLETIGNYAFAECDSLTAIHIPATVRHIGWYSFRQCPQLTTIDIAEDNPVYDSREGCNAVINTGRDMLEQACPATVIPQSVRIIGQQAFYGIASINRITLPTALAEIHEFAFQNCTGLHSVHIPDRVNFIGDNPFAGCRSLDTITVDSANTHFDSRSSCQAIIRKNNLSLVSGCRSTVIPAGIHRILPYAFKDIDGLQRIVLPDNVITLGAETFAGCIGVHTILSADMTAPEVAVNTFGGIDPDIPVHIRPGSLASYQNRWTYFHNFIEDFPVGLDEPAPQEKDYRVVFHAGLLTIDANHPMPLRIYDLTGRLLHSTAPAVHTTLHLPTGTHVVLVQAGCHPVEKILTTSF